MKLKNKTALVTGGSQGIGKAIAQRFKDEGAEVIIFDKKTPDYEVDFYKVDIASEEDIKTAFANIENLDILVNNAGVYLQSLVEDTDKRDLDKVIDIDFKGTYLTSKHAAPLLKKAGGASIINISSGLSITPEPESPAYCSAKAAVNMLTRCMAKQYAEEGIRVNAILPGPINTPLLRSVFTPEELETYTQRNPMKRIGAPEEVAELALFLVSDQASYITGGLYPIDGGESI